MQYLLHGGVPERGETVVASILIFNACFNFILQTVKNLLSLRR